jgi:NodT family efflux transporter outer membrane factor (OMF) lipoprotein
MDSGRPKGNIMFYSTTRRYRLLVLVASAMLGACTVGPNYVRPAVETPAAYKESAGWKQAQPADTQLGTKWWELFSDPELNRLEEQVIISNQNIALAASQYRQARALLEGSRSALYPSLTVGASGTRSQGSANAGRGQGGVQTDYLLPANLSWEIDVWGRIRRSIEASQAGLQASAADLAAAQLSVQAELAADYFQLRSLDAQKQFLDETVVYYRKTLDLTGNRYSAGISARVDVLQAETQLKSTQAQTVDLGVQRAQLEHAIAVLIGKPAALFSLAALPLTEAPPPIPLALPSELLERRPDIASAERHMAAANAQIGITRAAYYPTVKLSASFGLEASDIAKWLAWPSRFWSVGPSVSETIFDGGLRNAQNEQTLAAYDGSVASYRQTVLSAFQDVEDNLAALRILADESAIQDEAVEAARQTSQITLNQYQSGVVGYLNVITAQTAELANRRTAIAILGRRMTAAVQLIKALGGGWDKAGTVSR